MKHSTPSKSQSATFAPVYTDVLELVGNTPMLEITRIDTGPCRLLLKLESQNPGNSIKDRIAIAMIDRAEAEGVLKPGGHIVEATAGNTGIALALVGTQRDYSVTVVVPDKMAEGKIAHLRALGAEVVMARSDVEKGHPDYYQEVAAKIAAERGAFYVNQFSNQANVEAHYETTAPEIWNQTNGEIDAFVVGVGSGGTVTGVGRYLKERDPSIRVIGVDPEGSVFHDQFHHGRLSTPHVYQVEGIGEDYLVEAVDFSVIDDIIRVDDRSSFLTARRLVREEGLLCGGSSGAAMWGALQVADRFPGGRIVVLLPDSGNMYLSKFLDDDWMVRHGHLAAPTAATPQAMAAVAGAE